MKGSGLMKDKLREFKPFENVCATQNWSEDKNDFGIRCVKKTNSFRQPCYYDDKKNECLHMGRDNESRTKTVISAVKGAAAGIGALGVGAAGASAVTGGISAATLGAAVGPMAAAGALTGAVMVQHDRLGKRGEHVQVKRQQEELVKLMNSEKDPDSPWVMLWNIDKRTDVRGDSINPYNLMRVFYMKTDEAAQLQSYQGPFGDSRIEALRREQEQVEHNRRYKLQLPDRKKLKSAVEYKATDSNDDQGDYPNDIAMDRMLGKLCYNRDWWPNRNDAGQYVHPWDIIAGDDKCFLR